MNHELKIYMHQERSGTESTFSQATTGLLYHPWMIDENDECGEIGGMNGRGNRSTQRETCLSAALSTINPK
jgi:hypothetical protein